MLLHGNFMLNIMRNFQTLFPGTVSFHSYSRVIPHSDLSVVLLLLGCSSSSKKKKKTFCCEKKIAMTNNAECIELSKSEIMDKFQFYSSSPGYYVIN